MLYSKGTRAGYNESRSKSKQRIKANADQFRSAESD